MERRNDLDGRGHLSEEALSAFTEFFLETCIDQVNFMESLVEPDRLRARIMILVEEEIRVKSLPANAGIVLEAALYRGYLPRGDIGDIIGASDRHAKRLVSTLIERGVLTSESPRSPLHIMFPADLASCWFPGLYPEQSPLRN